jgi:Domain of unknown function (DUF4136)
MIMKTNLLSHSKTYVYLLAIVPWFLFGCGTTSQVFTDYDKSAHITEYKTFGWSTPLSIEVRNNPLYYNELSDKRIKSAVTVQLESRNYKYSEDPDLEIHYHIIIEDKTVMRTDPYGYYYGPYWMRSEVSVYEYQEGTLIIDLMDAKTDNLVWRGWITNFLKNRDPEKMEESINNAVRMIFAEYPYRANQIEPETE